MDEALNTVEKEYLGDSVYVDFDGFYLTLTTEFDPSGPSNTILLEPSVLLNLVRFVARLRKPIAETRAQLQASDPKAGDSEKEP